MSNEKNANEVLGEIGTDIAVVREQHEGAVAIFATDAASFWTSLKPETMTEKAAIANAMSNPTYKLGQVAEKKIIMAEHVLAHKVQLTSDATGETEVVDRIVIICPNGETVAGVSKGFKGGLTNIMNVFGQPPYKPEPLPLLITQVETRKGNRTYNIAVVLDSKLDKIGLKGGK